jgi:hypothetical protein
MGRSVPLMIGWTVVWFITVALIVARGGKAVEVDAPLKALPAPDA